MAYLGSERSVEHLALSARTFVPFVGYVRFPLYASEGGAFAAEATLWRFVFPVVLETLSFSGNAVGVEDLSATFAVPLTILSSPYEPWV